MAVTIHGTNGLTFNDATTQASGFSQGLSSGWTKLPNGVILQWGRTAQTSGSNGGVGALATTFPIAFPTAVQQVICQHTFPNELNAAQSAVVTAVSSTSFSVVTCRYGGGNPVGNVAWLAIGY